MKPEIIGNRIRELMKIENIDKKKLANNLEITQIELEKKLNGEKEFYLSQIMKIKEIFNLNLDFFEKLFFEEDFKIEEILSK